MCADELAVMVRCAAAGRDHAPCCSQRGVPQRCLSLSKLFQFYFFRGEGVEVCAEGWRGEGGRKEEISYLASHTLDRSDSHTYIGQVQHKLDKINSAKLWVICGPLGT